MEQKHTEHVCYVYMFLCDEEQRKRVDLFFFGVIRMISAKHTITAVYFYTEITLNLNSIYLYFYVFIFWILSTEIVIKNASR